MGGNSHERVTKNQTLFEVYATDSLEESSEWMYESILENAIRYLNRNLYEAEKMTLREYYYEMYSFNLREIDKEQDIHLLAWQINQAQATKKKGNKTVPYFNNFNDFFNYEKRINGLKPKTKTESALSGLLKKANS